MQTSPSGPTRAAVLARLYHEQGALVLVRLALRVGAFPLWRRLPSVRRRSFVFAGRSYPLHVALYRFTWTNERAVEIPLGLAQLDASAAAETLEVGNVLRHYGASAHRVIDLYERAPGVENLDVLALPPEPRFRSIVSVSTLEHVGWDETPRDPMRSLAAVAHLRRCLAPEGTLLFTVPMGWHPTFDAQLLDGAVPGLRLGCLLRTGDLEWSEVSARTQRGRAYGRPFPAANAVLVGTCGALDRR